MPIDETLSAHPQLTACRDDMEAALAMLHACSSGAGTIYVCGNGGSAADSDHITGELLKGFFLKRRLTEEQTAAIAEVYPSEAAAIAGNLQQGIAAVSLASNGAIVTAVANDTDADYIFAQQVYAMGRAGDVLICISTSGTSKNVVTAAKVARTMGLKVLALTGESGGALKDHADVAVRVPAKRVDRIQELHLPVYHYLCAGLEAALFGGARVPDAKPKAPAAAPSPLPDRIELVVFDFDGVFTDNKVYTDQDGIETVACDRRDGLGITMMREAGVPMFVVSKERNPVILARTSKLKLDALSGCDDKGQFLKEYFAEHGIDPGNVVYMGNDLNDMEPMRLVGCPAAPADAHPDILAIARVVVPNRGGDGAVRALCEMILGHRGNP